MFSFIKSITILPKLQIKYALIFILIIWIIGLFFSRFLQSVATISSCLLFIPSIINHTKNWKKYQTSLIGISFFIIVLVYFIPILYSQNQVSFWNIFKNKIPFLFLPMTILSIGYIEKKWTDLLTYLFIICCLLSSIWSYHQYLQNIDLYTNLYTHGQVLPTLIHHIPFAVLLSIGLLFSLFNMLKKISVKEKIVNTFFAIWLFYFIHVLSVRTGLILTYTGLILFIIILLLKLKNIVFTIGFTSIIMIISILAYKNITTIQHKINYTKYGLSLFKNGQDTLNQVSDSRRFLSDEIGIELIKQHPILGVGFGDLQDEMDTIYKQRYPLFQQDVYSPIHNQYLYTIAGSGLIMGILFIIALLLPLIQFVKWQKWQFSMLYCMLLLVMLWEAFLQNQIGTSIYLIIVILGVISTKEDA
jgi:O-antigen ligase